MMRREFMALVAVAVLSAAATVAVSSAVKSGADEVTTKHSSAESCGVARWLGLTSSDAAALAPLEAAYQADRAALERALANEREMLATLLERPESSDARLREQVERVVAADGALEHRAAEFLIAVRPLLSPEQQRKLLGRSADGVREAGGYRWRHGQSHGSGGERGGRSPSDRGPGQGRGARRGDGPGHSSSQPGRP